MASQPLDRMLPPWLANPHNPIPGTHHTDENSGGKRNRGWEGEKMLKRPLRRPLYKRSKTKYKILAMYKAATYHVSLHKPVLKIVQNLPKKEATECMQESRTPYKASHHKPPYYILILGYTCIHNYSFTRCTLLGFSLSTGSQLKSCLLWIRSCCSSEGLHVYMQLSITCDLPPSKNLEADEIISNSDKICNRAAYF